ncbi:hypothetical protein BX600DRAFT_381886 [Xylariales sp. PMI_506]|nr:hypothetical protein BX600DRAFT_381886 [Xylariales sp. PMI_506]
MPEPLPLPTRFPCWCRAVYSWGGESQRDLGFVEGDLIECLNAGDGSWWTGRLRRNKTVGVFPSNFVEVLPGDFRPVSRSLSPLPSSNTPSPTSSVLQKSKSKPFRKPFEAYAKAPHYTTAKQPEVIRDMPQRQNSHSPLQQQPDSRQGTPLRQDSNNSYQQRPVSHDRHATPDFHGYNARAPSPIPPISNHMGYGSRAPSPAPPVSSHGYGSRAPSPAPLQMSFFGTRVPSPQPPPAPAHYGSRAPSPSPSFNFTPYRPGAERSSPPPPAPPPHRHALLNRGGSNASYEQRPRTPRAPSPLPPSPGGDGFTPSPLREAMDGVIEQLDALGMKRDTESPEPSTPWSPESFEMIHHRSKRKPRNQARPQTAMGLATRDEGYETYSGGSSAENTHHSGYREDPLSNYVERMESQLRQMHHGHSSSMGAANTDMPPPPPPKAQHHDRPKSSMGMTERRAHKQKSSSYDVGRHNLNRTATTKTTSTNVTTSSTNTQSTNRSLMSGTSAGGISATSAGSLARKNRNRARSALGFREGDEEWMPDRPTTPFSGVSYHPSHSSSQIRPQSQAGFHDDGIASIGGLVQPGSKPKKSNFIKRILEATKTGVATSRNSIVMGSGSSAGVGSVISSGRSRAATTDSNEISITGIQNTHPVRDAAREMGLGNGVDWVQVRRDVNRSNTLSRNERNERRDRCQMLDYPAIDPVDEFHESVEGDEGADEMPVHEPTNYQAINLSQVDKNSRFIISLSPMTTAITLATTYVCRPYRSDVQRLRAIFTWVAEKITWEEDFEGEIDTRRVIQTKRGCAEEYAVLVHEMCAAVGLHSEIVRGYLKTPGEVPETGIMPRSNHWWNAVIVDNEWRMIDCCLASASNPRRALYSSSTSPHADPWWFLTRPSELCWTHIPEHHEQQHICPPVAHEILLNLPGTCPPYFKNGLAMVDYNTSLTRIEDLEMVHVKFNVPPDIEVAAEVEVRALTRDPEGDFFESGEVIKKRALAQAEWYNGAKRYTVKALLPGDEGTGILKVYAGKRGLMHSIKDIPHPLAFALPIIHTGENPPYEFVTRHPTPHAQRHDIYVVQPQCQRLALNNTFVFAIRQHPSVGTGTGASSNPGGTSPIPFARPSSAMSMASSNPSATSSSGYGGSAIAGKKPAKLAIQTPGGKILRLMRKEERRGIGVGGRTLGSDEEASDGGTWETIIKCSERGVWRGLVLADRTARWCVFAEWVCVG